MRRRDRGGFNSASAMSQIAMNCLEDRPHRAEPNAANENAGPGAGGQTFEAPPGNL